VAEILEALYPSAQRSTEARVIVEALKALFERMVDVICSEGYPKPVPGSEKGTLNGTLVGEFFRRHCWMQSTFALGEDVFLESLVASAKCFISAANYKKTPIGKARIAEMEALMPSMTMTADEMTRTEMPPLLSPAPAAPSAAAE
jgi:hypothetical protein